ncbi:hypothetical protein B0H13DRAFT_1935549 [Mycena leptocephala]|nr:hypothetical protein B0H13DRAFT_1935549 [Mycena leptocephala]
MHIDNTNDPLVRVKISLLQGLQYIDSSSSSLARLYKRRGRFGADDFWALFAFVALIIQVVVLFLPVIIPVRPQPNSLTNESRVFYLMGTTFYVIICIVRIEPSAQRRRLLFWVAATFVAAALFLNGQLLWICESNPSWKNLESVRCALPRQVGISQLVTDVISDTILLLAPLPLFRNLIDKSLGYKLILMFSTCVVTAIVSLAHSAFILRNDQMKVLISAPVEIQNGLSLIVANIPVVIATMIGEPHQVQTGKSVQLTSVFWFREAQTAGAMEMHTIAEERPDPARLSHATNTAASV